LSSFLLGPIDYAITRLEIRYRLSEKNHGQKIAWISAILALTGIFLMYAIGIWTRRN